MSKLKSAHSVPPDSIACEFTRAADRFMQPVSAAMEQVVDDANDVFGLLRHYHGQLFSGRLDLTGKDSKLWDYLRAEHLLSTREIEVLNLPQITFILRSTLRLKSTIPEQREEAMREISGLLQKLEGQESGDPGLRAFRKALRAYPRPVPRNGLQGNHTGADPDTPRPKGKNNRPVNVGEESKPPTTRKSMKEPSANAFAAYRAVRMGGLKETSAAPMFGVNQSTISRWIDKVVEWLEAGNVLPDELAAPPPRPKPITMDPRKLEQGPRRRGRA